MNEWSACSCSLCEVEQALIEQLAKETAQDYDLLPAEAPFCPVFRPPWRFYAACATQQRMRARAEFVR